MKTKMPPKDVEVNKGWWVTEYEDGNLWHYKRSKRSMTRLYRTMAHMLAENPELKDQIKRLKAAEDLVRGSIS